jgi:hypothetical protein
MRHVEIFFSATLTLRFKYRFDVIIPIRFAGSTHFESSHYAAFSIYSLLPYFGAQVNILFSAFNSLM